MKDKILKFITTVAVIVLILSICFMDSESSVPFVAGMLSCGWIGLMAIANS